jgi:hypothetical protein
MSKALATKNVAAVALALAMVFGFAFAFATPAKADTLSDLQAQVQALLAQIASLQAGGTTTTTTSGTGSCFLFTKTLTKGSTGAEVMQVQKYLNNHGFTVAATGAGSPGNESSYFGALTVAAVAKYQASAGITPAVGYWGPITRAHVNSTCSTGSTTTTTTGTGTTVTTSAGGSLMVAAGSQPANSLAPELANRVPFTTFTLTNTSNAAVTINGVTVQRTGFAQDAVFAGVVLVDSNGLQIGTARTFDSNHQATIGTPWTLNPGQSMTYTVAGNMAADLTSYAGQVAGISVVGINVANGTVTGSLPISGAQQTINATLTIGSATAYTSSYDPNSTRTEPIGTTGLTFSGVRITSGSAEDEKLYSVTWNQVGSVGSTDIGNLSTVVNGTSYPVVADSTGKYFSTVFPGGILIPKGNTTDIYIKGDLVGNNSSGRSIEFDIYRQSDIYLVGQTYGYGITPVPSVTNTVLSGNHGSEFVGTGGGTVAGTSGTPFFQGSVLNVTAGTLSTVSSAGSIGSQNVAVNVPNQPLGGFTTNFTGEAVTVQTLVLNVASTTGIAESTGHLTNVSLVDGNGNVVAGPNDEASNGTITFTSSVTFPVGLQTYTVKGTIPSAAPNGSTYTISTNPSLWSNPQGQTSGSNVTITAGSFNMSTMTVEGPRLIISAASSPASTQIAKGSQGFTFANINLDASQSGEDIRLSSLPITAVVANQTGGTGNNTSDLTNCQLWNGSQVLNGNQVVNAGNWTGTGTITANFIFDNALTVAKGTVVSLAVKCSISSSVSSSATYAVGVNPTNSPSPVGVGSGISLTSGNGDLTVQQGVSGTMSVGSASLAAAVDPSSPSYAPQAGGTSNVVIGAFNLQPSSDSVNLQNIGLKLTGLTASTSDITSATIWNGSTQVGSVIFTGAAAANGNYYATTTVNSLTLPQNQQTVLTIKANLANVGPGQSGTDGHIVTVTLANAQGTGVSSGVQVNSGAAVGTTNGVGLFRSFPTLAALSVSSGTLVNATGQTLYQFSITPSTSGQGISLAQVGVAVSTSSASAANGTTTVTNLKLYGFTDAAYSQAVPGSSSAGLLNSGTYTAAVVGSNKVVLDSPLQLSANTTYYFKVVGDVAQIAGTNGTHGTIQTYVLGGDSQLGSYPFMDTGSAAKNAANFVWSPNATTSPTNIGSTDWTTGYGLPGLPSTGMPATTLSN